MLGTRHGTVSWKPAISRALNEAPTWSPDERDGDEALAALRAQLAGAKARLDEHRSTIEALGLKRQKPSGAEESA